MYNTRIVFAVVVAIWKAVMKFHVKKTWCTRFIYFIRLVNQANRVIKTGKTTYPSDIQRFMLDETVSSETLQNLPSYFWNMKSQKVHATLNL